MKTDMKKLIFSIFILTCVTIVNAQTDNEKPTCNINMIARYTGNGVEIVFFPDKKQVLNYGIKNGFIIERADITVFPKDVDDINKLPYVKVGQTKAFNDQQWINLLSKTNVDSKKNVELSKDFYDAIDKTKGGKFDFENGIKDMAEQKNTEDFEYLIVVMNAIKCKECAVALGLAFTDATAASQREYIYRVRINGEYSFYNVISAPFSIETKKEETAKQRKIYVKPGDKELSFMWDENDMISGTIVERKNPFTGNWEFLNDAPEYNINEGQRKGYFDRNLTNYKTYEYRFYGDNPFGERVLFGTAKGMPIDLTPPQTPLLIEAKHSKPNEISIKWEVNKPEDGDLNGFLVARGDSNNGKFVIIHDQLLPKETRSYIDTTFKKDETNYYIIQAVDTSGNVSSTVPAFVTIIDSIPPVQPKFVSAKIDSLGVVTLVVDKNKEKDLLGYRLYRANSAEHEFSVIKEGFNPNDTIEKPVQLVFTDTVTLNSLTPYIYYRIKALDQNLNQSEFSEILKIKRPDKIPPTTPVFKNIIARKQEIELQFALSKSEDVEQQYIYRKTDINGNWEMLDSLKNSQTTYIDKNVKPDIKYYYSLRAKDDSNLYSNYAVAVYGNLYDDGVRPPVENLTIKKVEDKVVLNWTYKSMNNETFFVIYKNDSKGKLVQYKNTTLLNFEDNINSKSNSYAVRVFTKDGGQSVMSITMKLTN